MPIDGLAVDVERCTECGVIVGYYNDPEQGDPLGLRSFVQLPRYGKLLMYTVPRQGPTATDWEVDYEPIGYRCNQHCGAMPALKERPQ